MDSDSPELPSPSSSEIRPNIGLSTPASPETLQKNFDKIKSAFSYQIRRGVARSPGDCVLRYLTLG